MVLAGNKAKGFSLVNHTTKTIHYCHNHHHHHHHHHFDHHRFIKKLPQTLVEGFPISIFDLIETWLQKTVDFSWFFFFIFPVNV